MGSEGEKERKAKRKEAVVFEVNLSERDSQKQNTLQI